MSIITTGFTEELRYRYALNENSRVIDCGFYKGEFALRIYKEFNCRVEAYEPIKEFYEKGLEVIREFPKITLRKAAIGVPQKIGQLYPMFSIKGSMSGLFSDSDQKEKVDIWEPPQVIKPDNSQVQVDLLKLNIEGMEFDVLNRMIQNGLVNQCKNIQVQFHPVVENCQDRYESIRRRLLVTHRLTYDFPWCWENYERID